MGDRISIQYQNGDEKSVILFSHWQGTSLKEKMVEHYEKVVKPLHVQNVYQIGYDGTWGKFVLCSIHGMQVCDKKESDR